MTAIQMLRQQHRHLEQELALAEAHVDDVEGELAGLFTELRAHLSAEASVFYSAAERALGQPLVEQRRQHGRVLEAISRALDAQRDGKAFPRQLFQLTEAFRAHVRAEERSVYPSLEGLMSERELEVLRAKLTTFRATVSSALAPRRLRSAGQRA